MRRMLRERLETMERVASERADKEMQPPWLEFPDYGRFSLGWRMGGGEDFMRAFASFYSALTSAGKLAYAEAHPEPGEWSGYYSQLDATSEA